jgi:5-methylcytosine-specific restriction endonuclease McrA
VRVDEALAAVDAVEQQRAGRAKRARMTPDDLHKWYRSWEWQRARYSFLKSLKGKERKCACCGSTLADGAKIVVDHVKSVRLYPELKTDLGNLQLLCDGCNRGKGSHDDTRWSDNQC